MGVPQLDRYEVIEELGQGGMSVVYRARDLQLNRDVALKVLHDFLARQEDARRRFHREAVAVAKLHHPGIVEIFDYSGPETDQSYIVCELITGQTLRGLIEEMGPIPHPELAALATAELTRALRHAHEQGIIHRDLKPENIMVTRDGRLKLMDFGIAQIMGGATRLTATGTLLGSPAHMAPEMIDGKPSDHRGDIFSLGTILYWLTTGALPFEAPNPSALFRQILTGEYEPAQAVQPRLGNGLARIIDRALALAPEDRYQDISELQRDLHEELEEVGLLPVEATARAYLERPRPFADALRPKLVARLAEAGQVALAAGNVGRAMDRFNRVLAVEPDHPEVLSLVRRVGRRQALAARLRQAAVTAVTVGALAGVGFGVYGLWHGPADARSDAAARAAASAEARSRAGDAPAPVRPAVAGGAPVSAQPTSVVAVRPAPGAGGRAHDRGRSAGPGPGHREPGARDEAPTPRRSGDPSARGRATAAPSRPRSAAVKSDPGSPSTGAGRPGPKPGAGQPGPEPSTGPRGPKPSAGQPGPKPSAGQPGPKPSAGQPGPKPSAAPGTAAPADPTSAETVPPETEPVPPAHALVLRISPGWADVLVNGSLVAKGALKASLSLAPGRHEVVLRNQHGTARPRIIEVAEDGTMTEVHPDGRRSPIRGELPVYTPRPR